MIHFSKKMRDLLLGQKIENSITSIIELIIKINKIHKDRNKCFEKISLELDLLFVWVRLAKELKFISLKQYRYTCNRINKLSKICIGILKPNKLYKNLIQY